MQQERLAREVEVQNEVYITMKQQHEMVKLELFDNTSMLQVLDEPELPLFDSRIKLNYLLFLSIITSLIFSSGLVILKDLYDSQSFKV